MLFNSLDFVLFAVVFYLGWRLLKGRRTSRWVFLTASSCLFYGWWDWRYLGLLIATGVVDFAAGLALVRHPAKKRLILGISMFGNIGTLCVFKYAGFAATTANSLFRVVGVKSNLPVMELILPIGISFYTFESLSYTIDVYRGHVEPTRNILKFFAFLTLFPHLVAGPIVRPYDLFPHLDRNAEPTPAEVWQGLRLIASGYFLKTFVADNLSSAVGAGFATLGNARGSYLWLVTILFAAQIYGDFAGYTNIARGLTKWMGYDLPVNFNRPYLSASISEFWTRWHISLSSWMRDYIFIPLGGSRGGTWRTIRNIWITMLVSGLWHGAALHFVVWGGLHAFYMTVERITQWPERLAKVRGGRILSVCITFVLVLFGWVLFRMPGVGYAVGMLKGMVKPDLHILQSIRDVGMGTVFVLFALILWEAAPLLRRSAFYKANARRALWIEGFAMAMMIALSIVYRGQGDAFIYFQF